METENSVEKISREVAEHEFQRFLEIWDVDPILKGGSVESLEEFEAQKNLFIRELCKGYVTVNDEGHICYKLKYPKEDSSLTSLTFKVEKGNKAVMDKYKEKEAFKRTGALLGTLTEQPPQTYLNMDLRDQKFPEVIVALFLG